MRHVLAHRKILAFGLFACAFLYSSPSFAITEDQKITSSDLPSGGYIETDKISVSGDTMLLQTTNYDPSGVLNTNIVYALNRDQYGHWALHQQLISNQGESYYRRFSISGDTAILGSFGTVGTYIFNRGQDGVWSQGQNLLPDNPDNLSFGDYVYISGDMAFVHATVDYVLNFIHYWYGEIFVYVRDGNGNWIQQQVIQPANLIPFSNPNSFGVSLSMSNDVLFIAEWAWQGQGWVHVYGRNNNQWVKQDTFLSEYGAGLDSYFGFGLSSSGNQVLVGAMGDCPNYNYCPGMAYFFTKQLDSTWSRQIVVASDGLHRDEFGFSASIDGDKAVIGARLNGADYSRYGSAYLFTPDGDGIWTQKAKLTASDAAAQDLFGTSVALSGDTAVITSNRGIYIFNLVFHSTDQNLDRSISLSELLRVIQFFNLGSISCLAGSEDGYFAGNNGDFTCIPHSNDYEPQDWSITLGELLRMIQLFNVGSYSPCSGIGEDGFCPDTN